MRTGRCRSGRHDSFILPFRAFVKGGMSRRFRALHGEVGVLHCVFLVPGKCRMPRCPADRLLSHIEGTDCVLRAAAVFPQLEGTGHITVPFACLAAQRSGITVIRATHDSSFGRPLLASDLPQRPQGSVPCRLSRTMKKPPGSSTNALPRRCRISGRGATSTAALLVPPLVLLVDG